MPTGDETNPFTASWSAQGHTLCLGHWRISFQGLELVLPSDVRDNHMGSFGIFSFLFPDDEDYAEGLMEDDWIVANIDWLTDVFVLHQIPVDEVHMRWFYQAVNHQDWRCGSCGGCI